MSEEVPSGDRAVFAFLEMIALAFAFAGAERLLDNKSIWSVAGAWVASLFFFIAGIKWAWIRTKIGPRSILLVLVVGIASDARYRIAAALLIALYISIYFLVYIHTLRSDIDAYVIPRVLTDKQSADFQDYLNKNGSGTVTVKYIDGNPEARDYAMQIYVAIRKTAAWKAEGVIPADTKTNGMGDGLNLFEEETIQPSERDTTRKRPYEILEEAFSFAQIPRNGGGGAASRPVNSLAIVVGPRPVSTAPPPLKSKIGSWIIRSWIMGPR